VSYDGVLSGRLGIGALFMQDGFAGLTTTKGQASLSYTIESPINQIGFGISGEYIQHRLKNGVITNPLIDIQDQLLLRRTDGTSFFDASVGVYGIYDKKFKYGISLPSLISSRIDDSTNDFERDLGVIVQLAYRLYSISTGISFEPGVIVKKLNNVPTHININSKLGFLEDKFVGGITYTVGADQQLGFLLGTTIDQVSFYYNYNVSSRSFQDFNNGAHEMSFKINLIKSKTADMPPVN
jgi:type IX secretion system PorP/SprF family membrane protein